MRRYRLKKAPQELFAASCRELQARRGTSPSDWRTGSLRSPATCIVAVVTALCLFTSCKKSGLTNAQLDPNGPVEVVMPEHGAYTGAFMDFGDEEDDVTLEMIEDFETMVGKHQAIIASSS
jgi:hypothetical protein